MKKIFVFLFCFLISAPLFSAANYFSFSFLNKSDLKLSAVFISPSDSETWWLTNQTGDETMKSSDSISLSFAHTGGRDFDFLIIDSSGNEFTFYNISLANLYLLTFQTNTNGNLNLKRN